MENAEIGAREDDYDKMFAANIGIADLFELVKDYKQALFYFSRALQAGEKTATPTHIAKARFALGRVYWKLNDSALAIQNYEHFIKLAQMADDVASTSEAAQHLLQALETAVLAENWEMAGEMRYQLGLLYIDARDTDTALGYLTEFHQYCVATNNKIGQGKANEAMSEIFEMLDRASDAVAHMEKYLEVVGSVGLLTKAKAACKIGMLYYRVGDLEAAERSFQSYYAMARQAKDVRTLASARVNLGVVRAALNRPPAVLMDEDQPTYSRPVLVDEGPDNDSDSDDFFK
uniref:Tetratricopeptide repeat protein 29 n=2 Tax=Physcomitrium patens TaxID=3218 RepID=A0A7I4FAX0_PHYPA